MKAGPAIRGRLQQEEADRRAAARRRVSREHNELVAAIQECLGDPDPKVQREARKVAQECLHDTRANRVIWLGLGDEDRAEVARLEISDLQGLVR